MVLAAVAVTAGNALVQAMVTDGWQGVKRKFAALFGHGAPDSGVESQLDADRHELMAAEPDEIAQRQAALAGRWATRFAALLKAHPEVESELAGLVNELDVAGPVSATEHSVAVGGDMNIAAGQGSVAAAVIHGDVTVGPTRPGRASS